MSNVNKIWAKICRRWIKFRLQPIRVFCLHHVCEEFDTGSMNKGDWMLIDEFKVKVQAMRQDGIEFISLTDAYQHICSDFFRHEKYAVLTFDDGYASLKEILPWLETQHIPCVLFVNGKYLDGKSYRDNPQEKYLTKDELFQLTSPLIEIGSHGWEHIDATKMSKSEFEESIIKTIEVLRKHHRFIPFHAYTYGCYCNHNRDVLRKYGMISILIDGERNYNNIDNIHRELL